MFVRLVYTGIDEVPEVGLKFPNPAGTAPTKFQAKVTLGVVLLKFTKAVFCPVQIV